MGASSRGFSASECFRAHSTLTTPEAMASELRTGRVQLRAATTFHTSRPLTDPEGQNARPTHA